ncbi:hypothetical protein B0T26DRAFT_656140 [Lasiosphaeria miniovina]|uniref:Lysozyme n=1 Tax=Lasiosphaeria miniovina TaxID=1954250 RepID=A0AA40DLQ4_9PEZI|nr:uncharacterized protein B0T26DRAFT_656140 [Lasiosphaeria miniovina]KAK0705891.1 hypothetical protein B0T26DRAFT_656140 [Lasiosphaeria miniovina]
MVGLETRGELTKSAACNTGKKSYSGNWRKFPDIDTWLTFDDLFECNRGSMSASGSTSADITKIKVAIIDAAKLGVDERVILGIIMQESHGYVGVQTTISPDGVPTAGLMQCTGCDGFPGKKGLTQAQITRMIKGGTKHYKENLKTWGNKWSGESIYPALREYNSGSVNPDNLSDGQGATPSYVSDIANRFRGWVN